jgi:hypothetical protein
VVVEDLLFFLGEVVPDNGNHAHLRKETRGQGKVSRGASENAVYRAVGGLDAVKSDGANYQE